MAEAIGQIRVEASIGTAEYVAGAKKIKAETASLERDVKGRFAGIGAAVKGGIAGLVGVLSIGAFVQIGRAALDYASKLNTVSQQLGVTTKDLQTLRFAAGQLGVSQEQLETGLGNLTKTLGQVAVGAEKPAKAIEAIGLNAQAVAKMNTGDAFRAIADALSKVSDRAQRAAVETALFGESGAKLDTMLAGGSAALNELAKAAEELGIVLSEDQIKNADKTANKLDALKTVISANIAGVVADNADAILGLADSLAALIASVGDAIRGWKVLQATLSVPLRLDEMPWTTMGRARRAVLFRDRIMRKGGSSSGASSGGVDVGDFLAKTPRAPRARRARKGPRDDSARDLYRFQQDELRAQMDIARAKQQLAGDYVDQTTLSVQILDLERQSYENELRFQVSQKDLTQAQADRLLTLYDSKDALERTALLQKEEQERYEETARLADVTFDVQRDALEAQLDLASTAKEQRDLQLRLLDLSYRQEKARLEAVIADEQAGYAAKEEARRRLAGLNATQGARQQSVINSTMGPWEQFVATVPQNAKQMEEALQGVAVNGVGAITDGLLDAIEGTKSLGDAFREVAQGIIRELLRIMIQKAIVQAVGSAVGMPGVPVGMATGGYVVGSGTSTSDSIPAMLSNGEFVMNARAVRKFGPPLFEAMNSGKADDKGGGLGFLKYMSPGAMALSGDAGFLKYLSPGAFLASKIFGFKDGGMVGRGLSIPRTSFAQRIGIGNDNGPMSSSGITVHAPITIQGNATRQTALQLEGAMRRGVARGMKAFG